MTESDPLPPSTAEDNGEILALRQLDTELATPHAVTVSAGTLAELRDIFGATHSFAPDNVVAAPMMALLAVAQPDVPFAVEESLATLVRAEIADTLAYADEPRPRFELDAAAIAAITAAVQAGRQESCKPERTTNLTE